MKISVSRRKGIQSEAPKTLISWPFLMANLWGLGTLKSDSGLNLDAGSVAEVEVSYWALTRTAHYGRALGAGGGAEIPEAARSASLRFDTTTALLVIVHATNDLLRW
jgi:hypothetical protein